MKVIW